MKLCGLRAFYILRAENLIRLFVPFSRSRRRHNCDHSETNRFMFDSELFLRVG